MITTAAFWRGAFERAAKTFIQTFFAALMASVIGAATAWEVPWGATLYAALGVAILAAVLSIGTSIGNADFVAGRPSASVEYVTLPAAEPGPDWEAYAAREAAARGEGEVG